MFRVSYVYSKQRRYKAQIEEGEKKESQNEIEKTRAKVLKIDRKEREKITNALSVLANGQREREREKKKQEKPLVLENSTKITAGQNSRTEIENEQEMRSKNN